MSAISSPGRRRGLIAAMAVGALLVSGCGGSSSAGSGSSSSAGSGGGSSGGSVSGGTLAIGGWSDTTSPSAVTGKQVLAGTQAYFDALNHSGGVAGKQVAYTTINMNFDSQQALQAARTLVEKDHIQAVVGAYGTPATQATFPFIFGSKVPIVGPYAGTAAWYEPPQDFLWGAQSIYENQASAEVDWAAADGHKKLEVIYEDVASTKLSADAAVKAAAAQGVSAQILAVKFGTTDYSPILAKVQAANPDAVLLVLTAQEIAAYLKARSDQHFAAPTYTGVVGADNAVLALAGSTAEGLKCIALTRPPTDDSPAVKQYRDALAKYQPGEVPNFPSLLSYAMAESFVDVIKTIKGPITSASIDDAYKQASAVDTGILPVLHYSADHHLGTTQGLHVTVQGGKFATSGDFVTPKLTF